MSQNGLEARDCFFPAEKQPFYINYSKNKKYTTEENKNAFDFYNGTIYLPVYLELKYEDVYSIINILETTLLKK